LLNKDIARLAWAKNREARSTCLNGPDKFNYGAYKWTVQLVTNDNRLEKVLFPIFWGLMTLRYIYFFVSLVNLTESQCFAKTTLYIFNKISVIVTSSNLMLLHI
jgi:hypothetical protein